jgi:hypothetical protein
MLGSVIGEVLSMFGTSLVALTLTEILWDWNADQVFLIKI